MADPRGERHYASATPPPGQTASGRPQPPSNVSAPRPPPRASSTTSFFSNAANFEISGGNFNSAAGDMHTTNNYDHSHKSNFNNEYKTENTNSHNTSSSSQDSYYDTRRTNYSAYNASVRHETNDTHRIPARPAWPTAPGIPRGRGRQRQPELDYRKPEPLPYNPRIVESPEQSYHASFDEIYAAQNHGRTRMDPDSIPTRSSAYDDSMFPQSRSYSSPPSTQQNKFPMSMKGAPENAYPSPPHTAREYKDPAASEMGAYDAYRSPAGVTSPNFKSKNPFAPYVSPPPSSYESFDDSDSAMDVGEDQFRTATPPVTFPSWNDRGA